MKLLIKLASIFLISILAWAVPVSAYKETSVINGGTIVGKVVFNGRVPKRTIMPTRDKSVCGGMRKEPKILVGPDKGVEEGIVYLKKVKAGKPWSKESATVPVLNQEKCRFSPTVQVIRSGKIAIVNSDPVLHNTHGYLCKSKGKKCARTVFNLALPNQGQRIEKSMKRAGTVKVDCDAHGWMLGWMQVVDNPYYAITDADGKFSIPDVPPGKYTLVAFQGYTGAIEIPIVVKAKEQLEITAELKI